MADDTKVPDLVRQSAENQEADWVDGQSIMATGELRQLLEPEESAAAPVTAEQPPYDATITERFVDSLTGNTLRPDKPPGLVPTVELKRILQVEDEPDDTDSFDPYNRL